MKLELSKRDSKKSAIRSSLLQAANTLFEKYSFEDVTVADIANSAQTTVKTLFTYFKTKEDLIFEGEFELLQILLHQIAQRKKDLSPLKAMSACLSEIILSDGNEAALEKLKSFEHMADNAVLKSRLQMMWLQYEESLTALLRGETSALSSDPRPRLLAIQMIALLRALVSREAREHLKSFSRRDQKAALNKWFLSSVRFVSNGFDITKGSAS